MEQTKRAPRPETLRLEATRELGWMWTAYANTAMSLLDASPRHITDSSEASYPGVVREHAEGEVRVARSSAFMSSHRSQIVGIARPPLAHRLSHNMVDLATILSAIGFIWAQKRLPGAPGSRVRRGAIAGF